MIYAVSKKTVQVSRDPFARVTILRRVVDRPGDNTCDWCDQKRPNGRLFQYGVLEDGINTKPHWDKTCFCSRRCRNAYHG